MTIVASRKKNASSNAKIAKNALCKLTETNHAAMMSITRFHVNVKYLFATPLFWPCLLILFSQ